MVFFIKMNKKLIVIGGPTASGKTSLAIQLAQFYKTQIISADSRQFYKELSIGTAKPNLIELSNAKHHFIDSHSIADHLNAGTFAIQAQEILTTLFKDNNEVIVVGGSGLYINALINGLDDLPQIDENIRLSLKDEFKTNGLQPLLEELKKNDPEFYKKVDQQNHRRIIRALEIIRTTGNPYSYYLGQKEKSNDYNLYSFVVDFPRDQLYERINIRTEWMRKEGLLEEAISLLKYRDHPALQTVGYKELFEYIDGARSLNETFELIKQHTRNYAKRQLTWFRHQGDYQFLSTENPTEIALKIIEIVK